MRFKHFLEENTRPFVVTVEEDEFLKWCSRNAKQFVMNVLSEDNAIFRGVPSEAQFSIGDSSLFSRRAANTKNYVHSFISESPRWKSYPSRASAYICADNALNADNYSKRTGPYLVIPADDAHVGVCPEHDFWASFETGFEKAGFSEVDDVNQLNKWLEYYFPDLPQDDPTLLREMLSEIDREELSTLRHHATKMDMIVAMHKLEVDDLEQLLEITLGPELNKFTHLKAFNYFKHTGPREVWVSGKCAFVKLSNNLAEQIEWLKNEI